MYLHILNGENEGKRFELAPGVSTIGRSAGNTISISGDNYVSGIHAELTVSDDGTLMLTDKSSRNGTFLFNEPITTPMPLNPGDIFQIGKTYLKCTRRAHERSVVERTEQLAETIVVVSIVGSSEMDWMGGTIAGDIRSTLRESLGKALLSNSAEYLKSTGTGYMLIFTKPFAAVQFSLTLLRDILSGGKRKFHIRIAINYGETHKLAEGDRRGSAVDMAFRLESVGPHDMHQTAIGIRKEDLPPADRIFITENMEHALAGKPPFKFRLIGYFDLKGFNGRHKIFEVIA